MVIELCLFSISLQQAVFSEGGRDEVGAGVEGGGGGMCEEGGEALGEGSCGDKGEGVGDVGEGDGEAEQVLRGEVIVE